MKKYIKSVIVVLLALLFHTACVELDENPQGLLSPETFYASESAFEAALVGAYQPLYSKYAGFDFWTAVIPGAGAEDIKAVAASLRGFDEFNIDPNHWFLGQMWGIFYKTINNANALIGNLDKASGISKERIDGFEGQARFLRAFSYFYLTRYFGEVPIITFENQKDADKVGQSPVSAIYDFIIDDLKIAEEKLPVSFAEKGKANKGAAKALLAEVYLNKAGWPLKDAAAYALAKAKAKEVMNMGYNLEPDFAGLWLADNKLTNSEFIFALHGVSGKGWEVGSHQHVASRPSVEGGWGDWFSEARFYNAFPDGYRKDVSFHTTFENGQSWEEVNPKEPFVAKYRDAGSNAAGMTGSVKSNDGDGFTVLLRYADVLLIFAEASNKADGSPSNEAIEALNKVRRRANNLDVNTPDTSVDWPTVGPADFDDAVIAERAWELAFEGKRWFDLVRREMVVEVNKDVHPNVKETNRLLPKPALEVTLTEGLEQNTGY